MWWITKRPDAQVIRDQADWRGDDRRLRVLSYRVILDVPLPLVVFVSGLLAAHRRELGTRDGTRGLPVRNSAGRRQCGGAERSGKGLVREDGGFCRRGSDGTGLQPHYRNMESGASKAAAARARRPAGS